VETVEPNPAMEAEVAVQPPMDLNDRRTCPITCQGIGAIRPRTGSGGRMGQGRGEAPRAKPGVSPPWPYPPISPSKRPSPFGLPACGTGEGPAEPGERGPSKGRDLEIAPTTAHCSHTPRCRRGRPGSRLAPGLGRALRGNGGECAGGPSKDRDLEIAPTTAGGAFTRPYGWRKRADARAQTARPSVWLCQRAGQPPAGGGQ